MANNRYQGMRYVPLVCGEHDKTKSYENQSVVLHQGSSYTSKKNVPVGIEITNSEYWVLSGNYNAQVENYRKEVQNLSTRVSTAENSINGVVDSVNLSLAQAKTEINSSVATQLETQNIYVNNEVSKVKTDITTVTNKVNNLEMDVLNSVTEQEFAPTRKRAEDLENEVTEARMGETSLKKYHDKMNKESLSNSLSTFRATMGEIQSNAPIPLYIHQSDYKDQVVHPSVIYLEEKFMGYQYFMVCTPYAFSDSALEQPYLYLSNDGVTWDSWGSNPIALPTNDTNLHHSDPNIFYNHDSDCLEIWYRKTQRTPKQDTIYRRVITRKGVITPAEQIIQFNANVMSPSVVYTGLQYILYTVENGKVYRRTANKTSITQFSTAELCTTPTPPTNYQLWHMEVRKILGSYVMLYNTAMSNSETTGGKLYYCESLDGYTFTENVKELISPTTYADSWDNKGIYKGSLLYANGVYRLFYSAHSQLNTWGIGELITLDLQNFYVPKWSRTIKTNPNGTIFNIANTYRNYFSFDSFGNVKFSVTGETKNKVTVYPDTLLADVPWYLCPIQNAIFPVFGKGRKGGEGADKDNEQFNATGLCIACRQKTNDTSSSQYGAYTQLRLHCENNTWRPSVSGCYTIAPSWNE